MNADLGSFGTYDADSSDLAIAVGDVRRPSSAPLVVAGAAIVASALLVAFGKAWPLPVVGWMLTPFVVVGCLAWARSSFVAQSGNPWFDRSSADRKLRVLQVLTLVSFLVSFVHVWRIGQEAALWLQ